MNWSLRDEMRKHAIEHLRQIAHTCLYAFRDAEVGLIDDEHLPRLSITLLRLPFDTDEEIDFEPRHVTPLPRENFEPIYAKCFGEDKDTWIEWPFSWECPTDSHYPMPAISFGIGNWPIYEDIIAHRNGPTNSMIAEDFTNSFYFLLEAEVLERPADLPIFSGKPRLIDFTNWRGTWLNFNEPSYTPRGGYDGGRKRWSMVDMYNLGQDDKQPGSWITPISPHHTCFLVDDEDLLEGYLLGSEVLCISMIMSELMLSKCWDDHRLFPVFCYTFSAGHVRITQGVFDDNKLQLRQTDPIDIGSSRSSRDNVKMLLRWMLGKPSSDTKWVVVDDRQEEQPSLQDPTFRSEIEAAA